MINSIIAYKCNVLSYFPVEKIKVKNAYRITDKHS